MEICPLFPQKVNFTIAAYSKALLDAYCIAGKGRCAYNFFFLLGYYLQSGELEEREGRVPIVIAPHAQLKIVLRIDSVRLSTFHNFKQNSIKDTIVVFYRPTISNLKIRLKFKLK